MKRTSKEKSPLKKTIIKTTARPIRQAGNKTGDVQKLVHLLQVHQIELEHQNQELRITQEELEVSRNKYVNLFDFSPVPYFTLDQEGTIKEVNLSASKMLGVDRSKLINKRFISFIPLDKKEIFNSFIKNIFNSAEKQSCELQIVNKDKRVFYFRLEGLELSDTLEPGKKCQIALLDLTEYKKIENSLNKSTEELKLLNSTKDKIFSVIAHDLRGPFQSLLGSSDLLATETEKLSQSEIIKFSQSINDNLKNLYSLLDNLLHWSLMQRDMVEFKPVNLNLNEFIKKIKGLTNQSAVNKNISITGSIEDTTFVYADADMLYTVIQNLIINAIKFTRVNGQINISAKEKNGFVEVSIKDTGIGIEPERNSKIFNFSTLNTTSGTEGEKGTGIGLPLCKEYIEKNGGKIWAESELGKGSRFIFTLRKAIS